MSYAELHCLSNFSFLRGASHPAELVERAAHCGYSALAITDECSLGGAVKAHVAAKACGIQLIVGSEFNLNEGIRLVALAPDRAAYAELSGLISRSRRRSAKGEYSTSLRDVIFHLKRCLIIWLPTDDEEQSAYGKQLSSRFSGRLWIGVSRLLGNDEIRRFRARYQFARELALPMVACGDVQMHCAARKPLHDVLTALRYNTSVQQLGQRRLVNSQQHLRSLDRLLPLYPPSLTDETLAIAARCHFSLDELRYEYPEEVIPAGETANSYLRRQVALGAHARWPDGVPGDIEDRIHRELDLITELNYEYYFLTVYDIVRFARERDILCQGRGSAANSVVCYCLAITEVSPEQISLLFERFISRERDEPPDIDVDFEHERREEVIQYIYQKYSRRRAALAATYITYRSRSAVRDIGKALGLDPIFVDDLAKSLAWWNRERELSSRFAKHGITAAGRQAHLFLNLVQEILGFPRHLSQHVGGFVISRGPLSHLVPIENAAMDSRTVIQWDKEDIESLGLLKVDILALGMLSAIRKSLDWLHQYHPSIRSIQDIPKEDQATYQMLQRGDSLGVFQIESRAQMSMLPRLKPACFYDLVIEIAIVRPGPIQGDMVHPYLRRRNGLEPISYPSEDIRSVLESTLGVPIFQEQVIRLAMVAAGFTGGEADALRRAITNWGRDSKLLTFEQKLTEGMISRGYSPQFARQLFDQIKGFGGYGFPESHSASFALLAYVSAWLRRHHPAAFYLGLLNSQPMGFYTPSQLIQSARRQGVVVLPIAINHSQWDHQLLPPGNGQAPPLRLGLRLVKGLSQAGAERIVAQREQRLFAHVGDLRRRARLDKRDMEALANADALQNLSGNRHQSQWQIMALEPDSQLLHQTTSTTETWDDDIHLPAPSTVENVLADYNATGLTLRSHPLALLRPQSPFDRCRRQSELASLGNHRFVRIAGIVTCRQRPGTASGVIFLTLEDETGNHNVVVWPRVQERFRQALMTGTLLLVKGTLEQRDGVSHVIAGGLYDYSDALASLDVKSRDFH
ncbi:DNA polymerase III, alpha subunit subfamily, putative [Luminiphilus syltensis NOR5-1B]|uniref:Error-prone DNA polymerase n=1 Tax=Luminiphilus syltensis NOR5-1B TaxID=565045 RepID=B8KRW7_9GAMM|nr:error-prone DNA polymerase [Luminiphilus syltensis]EED35323.1 DNA polymerase III, alpha subunit subfamily, putative [Luminiphilus syltensis NOR5-1B]